MNRTTMMLAALMAAGCSDALVGGECVDGLVEDEGRCVRPAAPADGPGPEAIGPSDAGAGGDTQAGAGGGIPGDGGGNAVASVAASSSTAGAGGSTPAGAGGSHGSGGGSGGSDGTTAAGSGGSGGGQGGSGGSDDGSGGSGGSGGGGGGPVEPEPITCEDGETMCGQVCIDLSSDPASCGACGVVCPSGLCEEGVCVGDFAGHLVVAGIPASRMVQGSPSARLLVNSVLLWPADPVRIAVLRGETATPDAFIATIVQGAAQRGRVASVFEVADDAALAATATGEQADVLLLPDGAAGVETGDVLRDPLAEHLTRGGVVIALASGASRAEVAGFLSLAELIEGAGATAVATGPFSVLAFDDAISHAVPSPFARPTGTASFGDDTGLRTIVGDAAGGAVVLHRAIAP